MSRRNLAYVAAGIAIVFAAAVIVLKLLSGDSAESPEVLVEGPPIQEPPDRSIAVLAFANLSPDPENEYLSDGLAAELLNHLTSIPDLKVAARTSAFAFKGKNIDVTEMARQLRVAHVLSGSVRQSGDTLRISAQLIDASDGYHVWSNTWESELKDIFDIQDEIASAVVDSLRVELLDGAPAVKRADPEAYALYLKSGEAFSKKIEPKVGEEPSSRHEQAVSLILHALAIDPDYAPAWARLAYYQFDHGQWMTAGDPSEIYSRAEASARRALELDPDQIVALRVLGHIDHLWHWNVVSAANRYNSALSVSPGDAVALRAIGQLYLGVGLPPPAFVRDAANPDPLNPGPIINQALAEWRSGDSDAARNQLEIARDLVPDAVRLHAIEALFDYLDGNFESAAQLADGLNPPTRACALQALGRVSEAQSVLERMQQNNSVHAYATATIYTCWGDYDNAFLWFDRAFEARDQQLLHLRNDMLLTDLQDDPRLTVLLKKIGISDEDADRVRTVFEGSVL